MKRTYPDGPSLKFWRVLVGRMLPEQYPFDPLAFQCEIAKKYGDITHFSLGPLHVYQLNHPTLIRQMLVEQADKFYKPRVVKWAMRPVAGEGLLTSDGALWKRQRKLIQPSLQHDRIAVYARAMVEQTQSFLESYRDGGVRCIGTDMSELTLGIMVKTLFGSDLPEEARGIGPLVTAVLEATGERLNNAGLPIPPWVPTERNRRETRAIAELEAILQLLIRRRRAAREAGGDLLSMLLAATDEESGAGMSDQQLRDELATIFGAGHDTTATALTWTWWLLSEHPEVEARLVEELQRVLAGRLPEMSDLAKLPYTEMVIREALRLYPPGPQFAREPIEDVTIGGFQIAKGALVMVSVYSLHRDARFFADPERFDPIRFGPGWEERIPRYAYLPFGGGPRVCIGNGFAMMEARLILATMAQRYRLALEENEPVTPVQLVTLRPNRPLRMRVEQRTGAAFAAC